MIYLEEHRAVGDSAEKADQLLVQHEQYMKEALVRDIQALFLSCRVFCNNKRY